MLASRAMLCSCFLYSYTTPTGYDHRRLVYNTQQLQQQPTTLYNISSFSFYHLLLPSAITSFTLKIHRSLLVLYFAVGSLLSLLLLLFLNFIRYKSKSYCDYTNIDYDGKMLQKFQTSRL